MTRAGRAALALFTLVFSCGSRPYVVLEGGRVLAVGNAEGSRAGAGCEVYEPGTDTWRSTGGMHVARRDAAAVRLLDGRVLVVGGASASGVLASAEVYAPETGRWTRTADLGEARAGAEAVLLPDGRVLVAGGFDAERLPVRSAELFEPATGRFARTGSPLSARQGPGTAVVLDSGEVLFVGGLLAELYDPVSGQWRRAGPVGGAAGTHRTGHSVTRLPDGRVLVVGGMTARAAATAEVYEPVSGEWRRVAAPGTPREGHGAVVGRDGRVLVAGGFHARTGALASVEAYEPASDTWSVEPPLGGARRGAVLVPLSLEDGAVLVVGGAGEVSGSAAPSERYVPEPCRPLSCEGRAPGVLSDGCGGTVECGAPARTPRCGEEGCGVERAVYDGVLGVPRCGGAGAGCGSAGLLVGRGQLGPEPHAPNTLGGACADGEGGTHARDEALDGLRVTTEAGEALAPGRRVRVEAMVWASGEPGENRLDLYAAADAGAPEWTHLATLVPGRAGAQVLTATYVLPGGAVQALRGVLRYAGTAGPCPGGVFDDVDDLVFSTR